MASIQNFTIDAGADYSIDFAYFQSDGVTPISLTGYTAKFQMRKSPIAGLVLEIIPTIVGNVVTVAFTAAQTTLLTDSPYVYGIELYKNATVTRFVEGTVTMDPEIVR